MIPIAYTLAVLAVYYLMSTALPVREIWFYQTLFLLVPAVTAIRRFIPEPKQILSITKPFVAPFLKIFGLSLVVSVSLNLLIPLWDHFFSAPEDLHDQIQKILYTDSPLGILRLIFTVGLFPAICEETLFRGYLQTALNKQWGFRKALVATSLIFAVGHLKPWLFPFYFLLGFFLGWCRNYRNNLYLPILAHWVNNVIALVVFKLF